MVASVQSQKIVCQSNNTDDDGRHWNWQQFEQRRQPEHNQTQGKPGNGLDVGADGYQKQEYYNALIDEGLDRLTGNNAGLNSKRRLSNMLEFICISIAG